MGFFSEIASEARRGVAGSQVQTDIRQTVVTTPSSTVASEPAPVAAPAVQPEPAPEATVPAPPVSAQETAPVPTEAKQEPVPAPETAAPPAQTPPPELKLDAAEDAAQARDNEAKRKQAHEAAEAKRKAEFDAKQAKKKAARKAALDKIAAMDSAELLAESVKRVAADTERLTRRNMKEAVAEHIQAKCREDAVFAMLVMDPVKSMVNCFQYINRRAQAYAEQEMKDNGIQHTGVYGLDVPDGLCYQWAEDYFNDGNTEEDHKDDEKFVPKPYVPTVRKKAQGKTSKKPAPAAKPKAENPSESSGMEQISLM